MDSSTDQFLTPGELCERWKVDWRTMRKFPIPWIELSPSVRRIDLAFIVKYEQANRLDVHQSS